LPGAGDVSAPKLLDVSHRIKAWMDMWWVESANPQTLVTNTKASEAPTLYKEMLSSTSGTQDQIAVGVNEAWMKFDPAKTADLMTALTASSYTVETLGAKLARGLVNPKLATLLPPSATPTKGQLRLGLTIAMQDGKGMPVAARDFLRAAAGGVKTATFPGALKIGDYLGAVSEDQILEDIGLSLTAPTISGSGSRSRSNSTPTSIRTRTARRRLRQGQPVRGEVVKAKELNVREKPKLQREDRGYCQKGDVVNVMGRSLDEQMDLHRPRRQGRLPRLGVPRRRMTCAGRPRRDARVRELQQPEPAMSTRPTSDDPVRVQAAPGR
jgi:hypothetical protein